MQALRISAATASDGRTLLELPPFVARGFMVPQPGGSFVRPGAPYRLGETPVQFRTPAPRLAALGAPPAQPEGASNGRTPVSAVSSGASVALPLAGTRVVN